jgi:L-ascorbate metabolism protein UlaG (beta-lactamase superfamily)
MIGVRQRGFGGALRDDLAAVRRSDGVDLWWLGQACFLVRAGVLRLVIDPYLSDSLAVKYRGREFAHERMMPPPIAPGELRGLHWCLCTHAHSDHMDPGTLPAVAAQNPACRFVVPRAERETALQRGIPPDRLVTVEAGETLELGEGAVLEALPSAHETVMRDAAGQVRHLGYVLRLEGVVLYHSGDCVPYPGLEALLARVCPGVALLPVNGRDEVRSRQGIAGNFTLTEAVALCREARVPFLLAHHTGMFAFNTVSGEDLEAGLAAVAPGVTVLPSRLGICYEIKEEAL